MEYIRQTISSTKLNNLFDLPPTLRNKDVEVIILPIESNTIETPRQKLHLNFVKGSPLPDSFFDPLPEEELQAWGL